VEGGILVDIHNLEVKKDFVNKNLKLISPETIENYNENFRIEYNHHSTAIEGNTLTLAQTKLLIEDNYFEGSKHLREIYEIVNHNKAFDYVNQKISEGYELDETIVKDIHEILMENIQQGGFYRNVDVYISGAEHVPPSPTEAFTQIKEFYASLSGKFDYAIAKAAYVHAEFVKIHPFIDGNGRTSRLIMNYILIQNGYLPISISKNSKLKYYETLDLYAVNNNLNPFMELIADLEEKRLDFYIQQIKNVQKSLHMHNLNDVSNVIKSYRENNDCLQNEKLKNDNNIEK